MSMPPMVSIPTWKPSIVTGSKPLLVRACPAVSARNARPMPQRPIPAISRLLTATPNHRRAGMASMARPPAITAWTSDSGAIERAATCRHQARKARPKPIAHQRERNRADALRSGLLIATSGALTAPRCLHSSATPEIRAQPSASMSPISLIDEGVGATGWRL